MEDTYKKNKDASSGRPAALGSLASGHPKKETTWSPLERKEETVHLVPARRSQKGNCPAHQLAAGSRAPSSPNHAPRDHVHPPRQTAPWLSSSSSRKKEDLPRLQNPRHLSPPRLSPTDADFFFFCTPETDPNAIAPSLSSSSYTAVMGAPK